MSEADTMTEPKHAPPTSGRGWMSLFVAAFVTMLIAAGTLVVAAKGFLASSGLLWLSAGLSALAIALALASVLLRRR